MREVVAELEQEKAELAERMMMQVKSHSKLVAELQQALLFKSNDMEALRYQHSTELESYLTKV